MGKIGPQSPTSFQMAKFRACVCIPTYKHTCVHTHTNVHVHTPSVFAFLKTLCSRLSKRVNGSHCAAAETQLMTQKTESPTMQPTELR